MDNHIQNLKKVCRFCGQKKDCLKPVHPNVLLMTKGILKEAYK